jgi:AhpD family alkylhydroperoxidase
VVATQTQQTHTRLTSDEYGKLAPGVQDGILDISKAVKAGGIEPELLELMKLRASQINGCAYCVQLHLNVSRKTGVAPEKLDLVAVWREAGVYSEREMAALAWTELITEIAQGVSDEAYAAVHEQFSEAEVAILTGLIIEINAWNRLGALYRFSPPIPGREVE